MEELIELRSLVQKGDLESALSLIDELEEMSKLDNARLEAFGGAYDAITLGKMVSQTEILAQASKLLQDSL